MKISLLSCSRAIEYTERESKRINAALDEMKVADDLRAFEYISLAMLLTLAENDIRSLDDLAGLDNEELVELLGQHGLSDDGKLVILLWQRVRIGLRMKMLKFQKTPKIL